MAATWMTGMADGQVWLIAGIAVLGLLSSAAAYPPDTLSLPSRLASIPALGVATIGLLSALVVVAHQLSPRGCLLAVGATSFGLTVVIWRRGRVARHPQSLWAEVRREPAALLSGLVATGAFALTRPPALLEYGSSAWRYWADGTQIADAGRVPAQSPQWGTTFPSTVSKTLMNSFDAASSYLIGSDLGRGIAALTWVPEVGWLLALWAVGYELGLRRTAPLIAVAGSLVITLPAGIIANQEMARDFQQFKAENYGRMLAFTALALAIRWLRTDQTIVGAIVSGLLFACAATTHLVATVVALCLLAGVLGANMIEQRRWPLRLRPTLSGLVTMLLVALALPVMAGGDIGFQGASGSYQPFYVRGQTGPLDPTAAFVHHFVPFPTAAVRWEAKPSSIVADDVRQTTGLEDPPFIWLLIAGIAVVALALAVPGRQPSAVAAAVVLGFALLGGALLFAYRYHTVVPGGFGEKRLFDYLALPWIIIACCAFEALLFLMAKLHSRLADVVGAVFVLGAVTLLLTSQPSLVHRPTAASAAAYRHAMQTIRSHTPCGARVLVNFRTTGSVQLLAHRIAVLEGMAPYLRPDLLNPTLATIYGARAFLRTPDTNTSYLRYHSIDYVALITGAAIRDATHESGMQVGLKRLQGLSFLTKVIDEPGLLLLRVGSGRSDLRPNAPGYGC